MKMKKQTALTLVDPKDEAEKIRKRFDELLAKTNKQNPNETDIKALKQLLRDSPELKLHEKLLGIMTMAEGHAIDCLAPSKGIGAILRYKQDGVRERLGYNGAEGLERFLIQHAALQWLRLALTEMAYSQVMSGDHSLKLCDYYERKLASAQRRFTRACETLERIRLMASSRPSLRLLGQKTA
jgi:hypothetical protein